MDILPRRAQRDFFREWTGRPLPAVLSRRPAHAPLPEAPSFIAIAAGAVAIGAIALGAVAIGSLVVGRLRINRMRVQKLDIDDLTIRRLRVIEEDPHDGDQAEARAALTDLRTGRWTGSARQTRE